MKNMDWYLSLNKPAFSPPSSVFAPVWGILYVLIAISLIIFLKGGNLTEKVVPLAFFFVQLMLNFCWPVVFFSMKKIGLALIVLIFLWIFLLLTLFGFWGFSKLAAILLAPYFLWCSFAMALNFEYWRLNR